MTVRVIDEATIALEGACPIEDAEPLQRCLLATPDAVVDWRGCERAHTAIIQVLLISRARLRGPPKNRFLKDRVSRVLGPPVG